MSMLSSLWRLLDRRQRRRLLILQAASLLMAVSTVSGIAAVLPFFTVLTDPASIERNVLLHFFFRSLGFASEREFVVALGIAFSLVVILANAVNFAGAMAMYRFSFQVGDAFQTALFDEYLHRSYDFHSRTSSSLLSANVIYETSRIAGGILQNGLTLVTNSVTVLFIIGSIVVVNPLLALVAAMVLGASYASIYAIVREKLRRNGLAESELFVARNKVLNESFGAIKEVILARAHPFFARRFAECCKRMSASLVSTIAISQSPRHVLEVTAVCGLVFGALYLSSGGSGSGQWIAHLSFMGLAAYRLLPALQQAFTALVRIRADLPAFENIGADLRMARERRSARCGAIEAAWRGRPKREIRLESVSVRHSADRPFAISEVTLRIPAGHIVGLIGANGSGKTTLVDALTGLLVPQSGHVEVDGIRLDETNRDAWRSVVAYVPQQIYLLDSSFAENIALGVPASQIDRARMYAAARLAQLEQCIGSRPRQYEEVLGDRGCRLSGGQRQRLGIARALYRGASVLVMDEATSALDAEAEQEIIDMLATLGDELTIVIIAHRLRSLRHCDLIYEMANGRILEASKGGLRASGAVPSEAIFQERQTVR